VIVSLIAAVAKNGVIGRNNDLPWRLADDMRHFVNTTRGHTVITGRKNYEAMGKALPKRRNLVLTHSSSFQPSDAEVVRSIEEALVKAEEASETEAFVIGGGQVYELALPYAHRFYRTNLDIDVEGDIYFPELDETLFRRELLFRHEADEKNECGFTVELWTRSSEPLPFKKEATKPPLKLG
jgi:dihydrofolate reductase